MASTELGAPGEGRFNPQESEMNYQTVVNSILDSYPLGGQVGRAWNVDRVTRWISALVCDGIVIPRILCRIRPEVDAKTSI